MKLFNMDLHISVIEDFKNLFPNFEITHWCLSGHAWVFNRPTMYPKIVNPNTWKKLDETIISNFQNEYDTFLRSFDGFICGFPGSFAMLFEKYNKPIIFMNAVRYDMPFCFSNDLVMLQKYKECLHRLNDKKLLIAVSNNKSDQLYMKLGCGLDSTYIPSLCAYTKMKYTPVKNTFLCYTGTVNHPLITNKSELGHNYKWEDLCKFKGIIHFPYEISTMSKFEQFTAGIPLFFPSKKFMLDNVNIISVSSYWNTNLPENLKEFADKSTWINNSDMYNIFKSPNVYIFDSIAHLISLLEKFEWKDDSKILEEHETNIRDKWKTFDFLSKEYIQNDIEFQKDILIGNGDSYQLIDTPTIKVNTLHFCYSHALVDGVFVWYWILLEIQKKYPNFTHFNFLIEKRLLEEYPTYLLGNIDAEKKTYKNVWKSLSQLIPNTTIMFEHLIEPTKFKYLFVTPYSDSDKWQRSPWNCKVFYPGRNVPPNEVRFTDEEIYSKLESFRNLVLQKYEIVPTNNLIIIDRKHDRKFDTTILNKLVSEVSKNDNWTYDGIKILEDMTFEDQVKLFASTKIFIFRHGSCLANLLWCPSNSIVFDLDVQTERPNVVKRLLKLTESQYHYLNYNDPNIVYNVMSLLTK